MFKDVIKELRKSKSLTQEALANELEVERSTIGKWETKSVIPSGDMLKSIAAYFNVSIDYLLGNEYSQLNTTSGNSLLELNSMDDKDIAKRLSKTLDELEDEQGALMFDGEPLDENTKQLLKISLENSIRLAKQVAKQKYTPKKYRKNKEHC